MKKNPEPRRTFTFDPPDDIRAMLEGAEQATGADRTTLIIEAIRTDLPGVVKKLIEKRERAAEEFFKLAKYPEAIETVTFGVAADKPKKKAG